MEDILKLAVLNQLYLEALIDSKLSAGTKSKRKTLINQLIKELDKDVSNFNKAYSIDGETLNILQQSYQYGIDSLARLEMPNIVIQQQLWEAYKYDPQSSEANIHRILKKASKSL